MKLKSKNLTYDLDFTREEILRIFEVTKDLKRRQMINEAHKLLKGKSLAMIFQKPSTRTRVSFEVGMTQMGGHALYLGPDDLQLNRGETIADTARVLSRYVDVVMARVFNHKDIVELSKNSSVPVINGLSDSYHPCQGLTDLFTVLEKFGSYDDLKISFVGDGDNNVTNSLMLLCSRLGIDFSVACPKKYTINKKVFSLAKKEAKQTGSKLRITVNPKVAVKKANVIYTDVWVSMGRTDRRERLKKFPPYRVNEKLLKMADSKAIVMHCLPAHRGEEITDDVIDGPQSVVLDQSENRLHLQKALLSLVA